MSTQSRQSITHLVETRMRKLCQLRANLHAAACASLPSFTMSKSPERLPGPSAGNSSILGVRRPVVARPRAPLRRGLYGLPQPLSNALFRLMTFFRGRSAAPRKRDNYRGNAPRESMQRGANRRVRSEPFYI
jgi:hypothetical protein